MDNQKNGRAKSPATCARAIREAAQALRDIDRDPVPLRSGRMRWIVAVDAQTRAGLAVLAAMEAGLLPELEALHSWYRGAAGIVKPPNYVRCPFNLLIEVVGPVHIRTLVRSIADEPPAPREPVPVPGAWPGAEPSQAEIVAAAITSSIEPPADIELVRNDAGIVFRRRAADVLERIAEAIEARDAPASSIGAREARARLSLKREPRLQQMLQILRELGAGGKSVKREHIVNKCSARHSICRPEVDRLLKVAEARGLAKKLGETPYFKPSL